MAVAALSNKEVQDLLKKLREPLTDNEPVLAINQRATQIAQGGGFPLDMYHETLEPQQALDRAQEAKLVELGFTRYYIHRDYPRMMYRRNQNQRFAPVIDPATKQTINTPWIEMRTVRSKDEQHALEAERAPAGCGPWMTSAGDIEALPADPVEAPSVKIARLEGELAALRTRGEPIQRIGGRKD